MSYAAEPYAQFVDDLLTELTGGVAREEFRFLSENRPFRLSRAETAIASTVRVFGQTDGAFRAFRRDVDFTVAPGATIEWRQAPDGNPSPDAVWPEPGTVFYASYDVRAEAGSAPRLSDRSPGSITRLLAESMAREYAVLSRQLEAVYRAAFLDTSSGRDLDQLVALVGVPRRRRGLATGTITFSRRTPAPADVFVPAGTRVSTAEPPAIVFETVADRTLARGSLGVDAPIQALGRGASAIVPAGRITVLHRPILGVESVRNGERTGFSERDESDEALRERARRAHEGAGMATNGALVGALAALPGLREKDVRISEDPIAHPGVVELDLVLPPLAPDEAQALALEAVRRIDLVRPVGIRVRHRIEAPRPPGAASPGHGEVPLEGDDPASVATTAAGSLMLPVDVRVELAPASASLSVAERTELARSARAIVAAFLADAGIGEILVYNRLVSQLMALDGVLDVIIEMFPSAQPDAPRRKNLVPDSPGVRPVAGTIDVQVGGRLVMLDVRVAIELAGAGLIGDPASALATARDEIAADLRVALGTFGGASLDPSVLRGLIPASQTREVTALSYQAEYVDDGVRIHQQDVELPLSGLERLWVRRVTIAAEGAR